jgi:hypothetical protein
VINAGSHGDRFGRNAHSTGDFNQTSIRIVNEIKNLVVEILNDKDYLANLAASAAFIHNSAALLASRGSPITATQIITHIPAALGKIL